MPYVTNDVTKWLHSWLQSPLIIATVKFNMGAFVKQRDVNKCTINELEEWASKLYEFIRSREDICTKHMVDFYIDDMWQKLPHIWQHELLLHPDTDLCNLVSCDAKGFTIAPGSLQEFLQLAKGLCLPKTFNELPYSDDRLASFGMTAKKSYEVQHMSHVIISICETNGIKQVLDFGSGKGYLSEHLSVTSGLCVVGIDAVSSNTEGAQRRNYKIQKAFKFNQNPNQATDCVNTSGVSIAGEEKKSALTSPACEHQQCTYVPVVPTNNYIPITKFIDFTDVSILLNEVENLSSGLFKSTETSMLVGLHTCGDLCSNLLRLFCSSDVIKSMCCVGCCYHHITEPESPEETGGFPLSSFLQKFHCKLGRNARMLGCQSLERQSTNVKQFDESMKSIFYRTILQVILYQEYRVPDLRKCNIGKVYQEDQRFTEYIRLSLRKLSLPDKQLTDTKINSYLSEFEPHKQHLIAFHQLRAMMAPCIESLIVIDRLLYLKEQPSVESAWVECLFNPIKSPRCLALVALKSFHK